MAEPYRGRFNDGWEALRERIFLRQRKQGVVPAGTILTDRPSWVTRWLDLSAAERALYARQMEIYAGFMTHTDAQIGKLLGFLDTLGVTENTIIMVLSDNGASAEGGPHGSVNMSEIDRSDAAVVRDGVAALTSWAGSACSTTMRGDGLGPATLRPGCGSATRGWVEYGCR